MSDQKIQDPTSKIQRRSKHQAPRGRLRLKTLELGSWIFSGSWMLDLGCFSSSSSSLEPVSLLPVMIFNIVCHSRQGIFDGLDEVPTTGGHPAQAYDSFAFSQIIGHSQNFAIGSKTVCGALDHLIGSLAAARIEHLQFRTGGWGRRADGRPTTIKKDCERRPDYILVSCQPLDQFIAGCGGVAGPARSQLRPVVQQTVAID